MIQRVQSLFLLAATICLGWACFMPIGTIQTPEIAYVFTPWVLKESIVNGLNIHETYYVGLLQLILAVMCFAAIFFFKNRPMQLKISTAAIIIVFILLVLMMWVYPNQVFAKMTQTQGYELTYSPWAILSVLPVAFLYLANKFIAKDEKKVRAADRLR